MEDKGLMQDDYPAHDPAHLGVQQGDRVAPAPPGALPRGCYYGLGGAGVASPVGLIASGEGA